MIVLITGPVRAGKSTRALHVARGLAVPVTHVVTARVDPTDREMADRIARHRAERGGEPTIELWDGTADLAEVVAGAAPGTTLLIDSLGTWVAGHLLDLEALAEADAVAAAARLSELCHPFIDLLPRAGCHLVLVSEEAGWGLVPPSAQGRIFRDVIGRLNARIAALAERTELVVAGYALDLGRFGSLV
jgi:adenosylcobinamide kinase/adenosylcobinamide-phosphate guanylyltransferase